MVDSDRELLERILAARHGPAWRWAFAHQMAEKSPRRFARHLDALTRQARNYLRWRRQDGTQGLQLPPRFAHIQAAEEIDKNRTLSDHSKILVVGNCPVDEIAERLRVAPQVIQAWESLFFSVRNAKEAATWIRHWVIIPEERCGNFRQAARLRFALAGPVSAKAVLDAESQTCLDEGERLEKMKIQVAVRYQQALMVPLDTTAQKLQFLRMCDELTLAEKRIDLRAHKIELRSQEVLLKYELARARLESAREQRAISEARREERRARQQAEREAWTAACREREFARVRAFLEERRAAQQRAATSSLAQLTWECSDIELPAPKALAQRKAVQTVVHPPIAARDERGDGIVAAEESLLAA